MSRQSQSLKKVLHTPVKDASPTSFHGETRCLTREARSIIRFVNGQNLLPVYELADVFESTKRAIERVVSNEYNRSKVQADNVNEDKKYIHPTLLEMLEDWAKKTKKQLKKERKTSDVSAASTESTESQESSVSTSGKVSKREKHSEEEQAPAAKDTPDAQLSRRKRRKKKGALPSPPASTMSPSPSPATGMVTRKRSRVNVESNPEPDSDHPPSRPKRVRCSSEPEDDGDSEFRTLLAFFKDLNYVPADLKFLHGLGLGPAELLLAKTFNKAEVENYFSDILQTYSKPIAVRTLARVVHSATDKHWKILEKAK